MPSKQLGYYEPFIAGQGRLMRGHHTREGKGTGTGEICRRRARPSSKVAASMVKPDFSMTILPDL
jgi:hypothetical protein